MSNIKQFFGSSIGFLGIDYPKESYEYKNAGNFAMGLTNTNYYAIKGPRVPCATNDAYTLNIHYVSTYKIEKATKSGTLAWGVTQTQIGFSPDAWWCDPLTDDIYVFGGGSFYSIKKIAFVSGTITEIIHVNPTSSNYYTGDYYGGVHLEPRDPLNLATTIWDVVGSYNVYGAHHIALDPVTISQTATFLRTDVAGTNQYVNTPTDYVSADKKIILGGWTSGTNTHENRIVSFTVQRGTTREYIEIPFDGNLPLVESFISEKTDFVYSDTPITTPGQIATTYLSEIIVLGSSVCFIQQNYNATAKGKIIGKRTFDRVDFDRWLTDICDSYNMPTGVGFY